MSAMGAWIIGHNLSGYLPESDTFAFESWDEAWRALADEMRQYADSDDESAYEQLDEDAHDDDYPGMSAEAGAAIVDSGAVTGQDWGTVLADNYDRRISFWLTWSEDSEPDE